MAMHESRSFQVPSNGQPDLKPSIVNNWCKPGVPVSFADLWIPGDFFSAVAEPLTSGFVVTGEPK